MSLLLNKGKIGNLELKNRVVMPPMCMYKSDNSGELKDFHMFHYTSRAMADVGLIIVEATSVEPKGRISSFDLGLWDDSLIENHKKMNEKLHLFGAKSSIQLAHAGRKSEVVDDICVAPSSIAFSQKSPYKVPKALSLEEITKIKELFVNAAIRAEKANYDSVELHAAHGYLLCEFLSPLTNKRDDIYGGSLENRCRLTLEIAKQIKQRVNLPLIVRISADEWMNEGWNIEDSIYLICLENQLKQALINILLNAKDAIKNNNIENGEIFISVKKNKSSVEILIEDNGGGIDDKEILKSIFDLYFTTKKESHGTGIGLYMTKIIIEQNLGGKIKAKNQNNGLKFKIKLPILTI